MIDDDDEDDDDDGCDDNDDGDGDDDGGRDDDDGGDDDCEGYHQSHHHQFVAQSDPELMISECLATKVSPNAWALTEALLMSSDPICRIFEAAGSN